MKFLYNFLTIIFVNLVNLQRRLPPSAENIRIPLKNCPNGILKRKEYRDLTPEEWFNFREALLSIQEFPSPDGASYSEWDWWTRIHMDHFPTAHE
jgi:hypothetical protein